MENRINSIFELEDGKKYVAVNQAIYQGTNYYLLASIDDEEENPTGEVIIAQEKMQDGVIGIGVVQDEKLIELLTKYLIPQE